MKRHPSNLFEPENNLVAVVLSLVELLDAKITQTTLKKEITAHPDYPSLLSISDVLTRHGIENIVAKFDTEKYKDLPTPFITQIIENGVSYFTAIKEINSVYVRVFDPKKQYWAKRFGNDFIKIATGVVLLVKPKKGIQEPNYKSRIWEEKQRKVVQILLLFCFPGIVLAAGFLAYQQAGFHFILPFLVSILLLTGAGITILLLWYEIDENNPFLKQICTRGKKADCRSILQSASAKVLGISWSAIGFTYFSGSLLLLLNSGISNPSVLPVLSYMNFLAIPLIFYSIIYQWKVAKLWCTLCLSIQALLVLQCVLSLAGGWYLKHIAIDLLLVPMCSSFAVPTLLISILLPALKKSNGSRKINNELQALKKDPEIFRALLIKQKLATSTPEGLGIVLGNADAKNTIIKVCNPYCNPCSLVHPPLKELMKNNQELKLQIIFTTSHLDGDTRIAPVKHLLAIADQNDKTLLNQALDDWYLSKQKDYTTFAAQHPVNEELNKQDAQIKAMSDWCKTNEIQYTPTLFINGYQMPANYCVTDLKFVLSTSSAVIIN